MGNSVTARKVKAKELSSALRRRFHLGPDEEVSITITKGTVKTKRGRRDPWAEIRGTLLPDEAEEMLRAIHENRRSRSAAPELDSP